jgi:hypothetical protein
VISAAILALVASTITSCVIAVYSGLYFVSMIRGRTEFPHRNVEFTLAGRYLRSFKVFRSSTM